MVLATLDCEMSKTWGWMQHKAALWSVYPASCSFTVPCDRGLSRCLLSTVRHVNRMMQRQELALPCRGCTNPSCQELAFSPAWQGAPWEASRHSIYLPIYRHSHITLGSLQLGVHFLTYPFEHSYKF